MEERSEGDEGVLTEFGEREKRGKDRRIRLKTKLKRKPFSVLNV